MSDTPSSDDGHSWDGPFNYPEFGPCDLCGRSLSAHVANQQGDTRSDFIRRA